MAKLEPFVISRTVGASQSLVWECFTQPERMKHWYAPKGFTVLSNKMDLRVGGTYLYGLHSSDGKVMWGKAVYREIKKLSRLVYVNSFSDEHAGMRRHPLNPTWPLELLTTIQFEEQGPKATKITITWLPISPKAEEARTFDAGRDGMTAGWSATFEQLEDYLAREKKA